MSKSKPLKDKAIRAAETGEKPAKLHDSKGLCLEVAPKGGKVTVTCERQRLRTKAESYTNNKVDPQ